MSGPTFDSEHAAAAWMNEHHRLLPGWRWSAHPYGPTGWFLLTPTDPTGRPPRGARTLVGPDRLILRLSSNPLIHGFTETHEVLTEMGSDRLTAATLTQEIARRTAGRPQTP